MGSGPWVFPPYALRVPGRNFLSPGNTPLTPPGRGPVGSEVSDSEGQVKGRGGTCQQVTEAPHCRLQLGRGGRVTSHVLLVAEAQEPQLLHPARGPTDPLTDCASGCGAWLPVPSFLLPALSPPLGCLTSAVWKDGDVKGH